MLERLQELELVGFHLRLAVYALKGSLTGREKKYFVLSAVLHVYSQLANKNKTVYAPHSELCPHYDLISVWI